MQCPFIIFLVLECFEWNENGNWVFNSSMWCDRLSRRYGLPFVSPDNLLVSTINGTGAAIESVYVVIFLIYAPRKEKAKILGLLTFVLTVFSIIAFVSLFALHGKARKLFCGIAATVFSIIMYASPLSIMVSSSTMWYLPLIGKIRIPIILIW